MACFTAPLVESVIVTAVTKAEEKKEMQHAGENTGKAGKVTIPLSRRLKWLTNMLYGGSALLAFEHVWHGEITPWFPFLTAMSNAEDAAEMFHEIATVGVSMAALITLTWVGICAAATSIVNRKDVAENSETA
ncbi:MAG: hypothetical protein K5857_00575 [Lachnospiraceae bacterium]|nr:hypothetical protein [Lachnospiraceae bacterium]